MTKWNDKGSLTCSFSVSANEDTQAFFERMKKEFKEREESFKERIRQLFDEHIGIGGEKAEEAYYQVLQVFTLGYQCGWNDYYSLNKQHNKEL
jgi:predicted solute-binding protein